MSKISVIIPTLNREEALRVCIASLLRQTLLPTEVIIIDDGTLPDNIFRRECEACNVDLVYRKKQTPGLTASRNLGISVAKGDYIFFFDDDVELNEHYIEETMKIFSSDTNHSIGGVGGVIENHKSVNFNHKIRRAFDRFFLVTGPTEGRVLPSGFCVNFGSTGLPFKAPTRVDFLPGGVVAYRKEVFDTFLFCEDYKGYGLGEDKDFSFRVSKHFQLYITPKASLKHYESDVNRYDKRKMGSAFIFSRYRFFNDHVNKGLMSRILFSYAIFGYTLGRGMIFLLNPNKGEYNRLMGIGHAILQLLLGKHELSLQENE